MTITFDGTTGLTFPDNTTQPGASYTVYRNKIINGNFDIWQRGTSGFTAGYSADRWTCNSSGSTHSISRQAFASGDALYDPTVGNVAATYYLQCAVTSVAGAGNYTILSQYIEDVRTLAGKTITISFWAKASSGTPLIGIEVGQYFGTGGSPSSGTNGTGQPVTLSTTWTKYYKNVTVPSLNGKTVGTTTPGYTNINFWLDSGSTFDARSGTIGQSTKTVSIAQVQVEIGNTFTEFEYRPIGVELALCQRYYFPLVTGTSIADMFQLGGMKWSGNTIYGPPIYFPVEMRIKPVATYGSTTWTWFAGGPSSNGQIAAYNPTAGGYVTITGALTFYLFVSGKTQGSIAVSAATSFSGTAGDSVALLAYLTDGGVGWSAEL